jgi:glycosyltransferase involved in cell wall biosynthesis
MNGAALHPRICFAIESLEIGGAETHAVALAEALKQRGWDVGFAVMRGEGPLTARLRAAGIEVRHGLMPGRRGWGVIRNFRRLATERPFDVLFVVECFFLNALLAYRSAQKRFRFDAFAIIHNWPSRREFSHPLLLRPRVNLMNELFDRMIFISERQRAHYEKNLGIAFRRTTVIANGVDLERFYPVEPGTCGLVRARPLRVGIIASLTPRKGHEFFLRAAAAIRRHRSGVEFLIIGDGPRRAELERMARELGLESAVQFLGNRDDVPELLRTLDVVALTSYSSGGHAETLPLTLLEAGANGVPAVATGVGAVADIVLDGQTGYVVPPGNAGEIARGIELLLDDPDLRNRLGAAAREHVAAHFGFDEMLRKFEAVLQR